MIDKFLRRFSVRQRIMSSFLIIFIVSFTLVPLVMLAFRHMLSEQEQISEDLLQANRLVYSVDVRVVSSRANILQYLKGNETAIFQAQDDINQAKVYLDGIQVSLDSVQSQQIDKLKTRINEYQALAAQLQEAYLAGDVSEVERLEDVSLLLGADIDHEIASISYVYSEKLREANLQLEVSAKRRIFTLAVIFTVVTLVTFAIVFVVIRSITNTVNMLRMGADTLRQGQWTTTFDTSGTDEFSVLASTFNQMTAQLLETTQELERRVTERTNALYTQTTNLEAILDISKVTTEILDINLLLQQAVDVILQRFDLYYVGLFLVDEINHSIVLRAGTGNAGKVMLERGHYLDIGQGMIGWCVENGQVRVSQDAASDAIRVINVELPETRSEAAIPLHARERVIGALTIQADVVGAFSQEQIDLFQVMADLLAITIVNVDLYTETQNALQAVSSAYGQMTREGWAKQLSGRPIGYQTGARGSVAAVTGAWDPVMKQTVQTRKTLLIDDGQTMVLPLPVRESVIGVLKLKKPNQSLAWTNHEITVMETIAEQIGVALESARLFENSQQREIEERLAREVTERMREPVEIQDVIKVAAEEIRGFLQLDDVIIHLMLPSSE